MTPEEWFQAQLDTGGHFYEGLNSVDIENLKGFYYGICHTKWCIESFLKSKGVEYENPFENIPLYEDQD